MSNRVMTLEEASDLATDHYMAGNIDHNPLPNKEDVQAALAPWGVTVVDEEPTLTHHGKPVELVRWHRKPMGTSRPYGGYPGYLVIRDDAGTTKTIRADLVMVTTR